MKDRNDEQELATVVAAPKQAGEAGDPWWWGGTLRLDGAHVDAAHAGRAGKPGLVRTGGQDLCARRAAKRL